MSDQGYKRDVQARDQDVGFSVRDRGQNIVIFPRDRDVGFRLPDKTKIETLLDRDRDTFQDLYGKKTTHHFHFLFSNFHFYFSIYSCLFFHATMILCCLESIYTVSNVIEKNTLRLFQVI